MTDTSKMGSPNEHLDYLLSKALLYQQEFYELLPNWTVYKRDDIKYLKQNIGYAIFGPPIFKKESTSKDILNYKMTNTTDNTEIVDHICYGPKATQTINLIVDKICEHGWIPGDNIMKCGIIYLLLINNNSSAQCDKKESSQHIALPLFKIQKYTGNDNVSKKKKNDDYTTWFIDIKGRIYKSWDNFMTTNDLPECIMVYPKDGYYQPDPRFDITPNNSFVWVVAKDSLACSDRAKVYSHINTTVNIIGTGATVGLGIASFCTPVGPIMTAAGLITAGASGIWTIGKCSAELYDRSIHEESISPFNRTALSSWLGIVGCTIGIGVSGGSVLIGRAAASGTTVSTVAKTTYNTVLVGSISINLIGVGYQAVNIYEKYKETGTVEMQDIFYFGTHLLFFMNSVVNVKFANGIIEITQAKVLREYEANLREDNLRKHFNYTKDKVAATATNKIEQNAAIIREINKFDTSNISGIQPIDNSLQSSNNILMVQQHKLMFNGITLIDPILFIADFAKSYLCQSLRTTSEDPSNSLYINQRDKLEKILEKLLGDLYTSRNCPRTNRLYGVPDFKIIINELKKVKNSEDILPFIFNVALILIKGSNGYAYLIEGCRFVWDYIKKNIHEARLETSLKICTNTCDTYVQQIRAVVGALFDAMDSLIHRFLNAFHQYINLTKNLNVYNSSV